MKSFLFAMLSVLFSFISPAQGAGDLTRQEPIEVTVALGTEDNQMRFVPNQLTFETGKLYKLILVNPSKVKHYFSSQKMASKVFTRKVQVMHDGRRLAEIKGAIDEIEVFPGGKTEWWFVPVSTGVFKDLHCHVKDKDGVQHSEMGMVGTITIK